MARGKGSDLVEEKQFCVTVAPNIAMPIVELKLAADPRPREPAARCELTPRIMQTAAAIAHQRSAGRRRNQFSKGRDAVWQRNRYSSK